MRKLIKVIRFAKIYGLGRTWFKVAGRERFPAFFAKLLNGNYRKTDIGIIGCGQYAFATVGYFINKSFGKRFGACFDTDQLAKKTFSEFYRVPNSALSAEELILDSSIELVYVTSNHASHSDYAIRCLRQGKRVYLEKPISVDYDQLRLLVREIIHVGSDRIYFGYNRPFARAIRDLRQYVGQRDFPITLSCFVSGHDLPESHWYRKPDEGTRICGNVGHWLDLAVHILSWGTLPNEWVISLAYSNNVSRDDNLAISLTSNAGDLVNIVLTARCEPFEGINESINFQHDKTICKVDDFRSMTVWQDHKLFKKKYWPKDVGHQLSIMQPFTSEIKRDFKEVINSTLLMLKIAQMVKNGEVTASFSFDSANLAIGFDNKYGSVVASETVCTSQGIG